MAGAEQPATAESAELACRLAATYAPEEALVRVEVADDREWAAFLVSRDLVRPMELPELGSEVDGHVWVLVVGRDNGRVTVEVPGEPISYGPRISVSSRLVS